MDHRYREGYNINLVGPKNVPPDRRRSLSFSSLIFSLICSASMVTCIVLKLIMALLPTGSPFKTELRMIGKFLSKKKTPKLKTRNDLLSKMKELRFRLLMLGTL